jgi:hypothetical protein
MHISIKFAHCIMICVCDAFAVQLFYALVAYLVFLWMREVYVRQYLSYDNNRRSKEKHMLIALTSTKNPTHNVAPQAFELPR